MRTMRNITNYRNIYKEIKLMNNLMKKEVSITLDEDILNAIDKLRKKHLGAKRSTVINEILKKYFGRKVRKK